MGTKARQRSEETRHLEELLSREFGIPREEITRESRFDDDLGVDWFDRLELLDSVEITFDVRISADAVKQLETVADLETLVLRSEGGRWNPVRGSPRPSPWMKGRQSKPHPNETPPGHRQ